jgi:hypothetical protein
MDPGMIGGKKIQFLVKENSDLRDLSQSETELFGPPSMLAGGEAMWAHWHCFVNS